VAPASMSIGSTYTPSALSSRGQIVAMSIDLSSNGICSLSGAVVTALAAGECVIVASQPGTANIEAALSVTQRVIVGVVESSHGAEGSAPVTDSRPTDGRSVSGSAAGTTASGTGTGATPGATGATNAEGAEGAVDPSGQTASPVSAAAVTAPTDDRHADWSLVLLPLLAVALLGGGLFYFIVGRRRWLRGRQG